MGGSTPNLRPKQSPGSVSGHSEDTRSPSRQSYLGLDLQTDGRSSSSATLREGSSPRTARGDAWKKQLSARPYGMQSTLKRDKISVSAQLDLACRQIGYKIFQRFKDVRQCLRMLDLDKSGCLDIDEFKLFFRVFNQSRHLAEELFDHLCQSGTGKVSFDNFVTFFWHYINPDVQKPYPAMPSSQGLPHEIRKTLNLFAEKAIFRYGNVRSIIKLLDSERSGTITLESFRKMFNNFNIPQDKADEIYRLMLSDGGEKATHGTFREVVGPFLEPTGCQVDKSLTKMHPIITDIPLTKEAENLLMMVGDKALHKYKTLRESIRVVDQNRNGLVTVGEARMFFLNLGLTFVQSDMLFGLLDQEGNGEVELHDFIDLMGPYLTPGQYQLITKDVSTMNRERNEYQQKPAELRELCAHLGSEREAKCKTTSLRKICDALVDKAMQKFRRTDMCLRLLDGFKGGDLTCKDLEEFFAKVRLPEEMGRQVFQALDEEGGRGKVSHAQVMNFIGPHLQVGFRPL